MTTTTGGRALPNAAFTSKGTSMKRLPGPVLPSLVLNRLTMRSLAGVDLSGQRKMEGLAPPGVGGGPQTAPLRFGDWSADGGAHARGRRPWGEGRDQESGDHP